MLDLTHYPVALQLLMKTDGTVTELIKFFSAEEIKVVKLSEEIHTEDEDEILTRKIFLQGNKTHKNWLYAQSEIYLNNLPKQFVVDLLEKNIPIGTLWINHRIETYKSLINQGEEVLTEDLGSGFAMGTSLLSRTYQVYNQQKIIMEITEKFPIGLY
jgi:chorismate-pyruvate lyase